jgi:hypothetical protein
VCQPSLRAVAACTPQYCRASPSVAAEGSAPGLRISAQLIDCEPRLADRRLPRETFTVIGHAIEPFGAQLLAKAVDDPRCSRRTRRLIVGLADASCKGNGRTTALCR